MLDAVAVAETVGAVAGAEAVVDGDADVVVEVDVVVVDVVVVPGVVAVLDSPGNGWKKTTRSNDGPFAGQPPLVPVELAPTAAPPGPALSGLVAVGERHPGHAVDQPEARHQPGDVVLCRCAALELERRGGDRAAQRAGSDR